MNMRDLLVISLTHEQPLHPTSPAGHLLCMKDIVLSILIAAHELEISNGNRSAIH